MLSVQTQFLGGGKIGAARQAGKIDDQRPARQFLQQCPGQHRRGDRVDDGVKLRQQPGQGGQRRGAAARTPGVGALLGTAGSHSDAPAQKSQPPGHGAAYPAIAQHKKVTLPNRALTQAQQQFQAAFGGGHGVQRFQFGPQEVIHQRQIGLPHGGAHRHTGTARKNPCALPGPLQGAGNFVADAALGHGQ